MYIHIHIQMCMHVYTCVHMYIYIYIYIYRHTYTYIHMYIYIYIVCGSSAHPRRFNDWLSERNICEEGEAVSFKRILLNQCQDRAPPGPPTRTWQPFFELASHRRRCFGSNFLGSWLYFEECHPLKVRSWLTRTHKHAGSQYEKRPYDTRFLPDMW